MWADTKKAKTGVTPHHIATSIPKRELQIKSGDREVGRGGGGVRVEGGGMLTRSGVEPATVVSASQSLTD